MSFSMQVKNELVKTEYEQQCCKRALLYGLSLFGKSFSESSVSLQTENEPTALLFQSLLKDIFNIDAAVTVSPRGRNYTASVSKKTDAQKLFRSFGHDGAGSLKIDHTNFRCEECRKAFLAGVFLACGTLSDPKKDYHLEFTVPYYNLSKSLFTLLQEMELSPKHTNRKGYNIVYFKESESIENCLYMMGASGSMFEMMNIKIFKDFRNKANRQANCETANINKMVNAVAVQITAIEKIWKLKGKNFLNESLESAAELRYENPDSSLAELAQLCSPPISRSGLNHRLKRIVEIANGL